MADETLKYLQVDKRSVSNPSAQAEWASKKLVWVPHLEHGFVAGSIKKESADEMVVELQDGSTASVNKDDVQRMNPPKFSKVEDMAELTCLNEAAVLHNLKERYYSDLIYTYSGLFCVVVNPYKRLPIYTEKVVDLYKGKKRHEMPPHVFAVTDTAYRSMLQDRDNQSILCTGESGAGKTENTKKVIQYLAHVAGSQPGGTKGGNVSRSGSQNKNQMLQRRQSSSGLMNKTGMTIAQGDLEQQLLQANPILEAFGNAKTIKNDNSSRFGKFIRINFDNFGHIAGANIETYLLEKSRSVRQQEDERNFHFFYQLLNGASAEDKKDLLLDKPEKYRYLSNGNLGVTEVSDVDEYTLTLEAMEIMSFNQDEVKSTQRVVAACLNFGNFEFKQERSSDQATMPDQTYAQKVCHLLGVNVTEFVKVLLKPRLKVGRELVSKAQNKEQVEFSSQALSKALYERLFKWLVARINKTLDRTSRKGCSFIGILDIAGFEIFKTNSYEQLCINYTNEKLQQLFNHTMFILEQEEYRSEGILWDFIDFGLDLQPCIDLIEKPMGILALLDEECWFPKATDKSFTEKLFKEHANLKHFKKPDFRAAADFTVQHYAGDVGYTSAQWLVKNMDPLNDNVVNLLQNSQDNFIGNLWKDTTNLVSIAAAGGNSGGGDGGGAFGQSRTRKGMFRTVGQLYKEQLSRLMETLRNTNPNFVRCIIPNHEKRAGRIASHLVLDQLRCNGVLEGIRICRQGFPNRIPFHEFRQRYELLVPGIIPKGFMDGRKAAEKMLEHIELDQNQYRVGHTKVFFRAGVLARLEEDRDMKLSEIITLLQARCRGMLARQQFKKLIQQVKAIHVIQRNCQAYLKLRNWPWWKLFTKVKPLLQVTRQEEELEKSQRELSQLQEKQLKSEQQLSDLQSRIDAASAEKNTLSEQLTMEQDMLMEAEEARNQLSQRNTELEEVLHETEARLDEEEEHAKQLGSEQKKLQQKISDLEEGMSEEATAKQKVHLDNVALEAKVKGLEEQTAGAEEQLQKLAKERKQLEEQLVETTSALTNEADKAKSLAKQKNRGDAALSDLEGRLQHEEKARQELDKTKRKLEVELRDLQEQLAEARRQIQELEAALKQTQQELQAANQKLENELTAKAALEKAKRQLESQLADLQEDFETEKSAHEKAERNRRGLQEELDVLHNELEEQVSGTAAAQEVRAKRETELTQMKNALAEEQREKEAAITELREKNHRQVDELQNQLDNVNKQKQQSDKSKQQLTKKIGELEGDLSAMTAARSDLDRKKKALESQLGEVTSKNNENSSLVEEFRAGKTKMSSDFESANARIVDLEAQVQALERAKHTAESHLTEAQETIDEDSRAKSSLNAKVRSLEGEVLRLNEALDDEEQSKTESAKQMGSVNTQVGDLKRQKESDGLQIEELENFKKKAQRDLEQLAKEKEDLEMASSKLEKTKKRMSGEIDDLGLDLQAQRTRVTELERKQKNFDKTLAEVRGQAGGVGDERDAAQKEARENATKVIALTRQLEEANERLAESERQRKVMAGELDTQLESKDDAGRHVHELEKTKRALESQVEEQRNQMEELEDELQATEDAKLRLEVNLQALKTNLDREMSSKDEQLEDSRRGLQKQLRDMEAELEEERKAKSGAVSARKKQEGELRELEQAIDHANKAKDDALRQMKKYHTQIKEQGAELEEARAQREEATGSLRDHEKKVKAMESDVLRLQEELAISDRSRRNIEAEKEELLEEAAGNNPRVHGLQEEKRRLEARIAQMEEELEEEQSVGEAAVEKQRKTQQQVDTLNGELTGARANVNRLEQSNQSLERQVKDLRAKAEESVSGAASKNKAALRNMENKLAAAEEAADNEARERAALQKANRRMDRKVKELTGAVEEERRHAEQFKDQNDKTQARLKSLKRQLDDAEEETTRLNNAKRKLQRELDEAQEQLEQTQRDMQRMRSSRSGPAASKTSRTSIPRVSGRNAEPAADATDEEEE
ncbi:myosin-10-like isoform X2 [Sycon ciliatum]|uniref:myosin-10-like isoform X2 n=1 Tax=Sycon ciliatum TaxID=27933 RepID=UPI0020AE3EFA|eukprot:scpid5345/ scgid3174/ Myosin-10; Cellular myosin heavy chain, type B; Myosin heavy chain 10; Myosin heavy chain, non-muscle IIb; Non-muscle myosin heavy chain B; Non-muscle myosin heavy chain IIb